MEVSVESADEVKNISQSTAPLGGTKFGFFPADCQMCVLRCMGGVIGGFYLVGNKGLLKSKNICANYTSKWSCKR